MPVHEIRSTCATRPRRADGSVLPVLARTGRIHARAAPNRCQLSADGLLDRSTSRRRMLCHCRCNRLSCRLGPRQESRPTRWTGRGTCRSPADAGTHLLGDSRDALVALLIAELCSAIVGSALDLADLAGRRGLGRALNRARALTAKAPARRVSTRDDTVNPDEARLRTQLRPAGEAMTSVSTTGSGGCARRAPGGHDDARLRLALSPELGDDLLIPVPSGRTD